MARLHPGAPRRLRSRVTRSFAAASRSTSLRSVTTKRTDRVLEVLTGSRLVTVSEETAEVAHEALLREWPRLRGWLEQDADGRRLHRQITRCGARMGYRRARRERALSRSAADGGARLGCRAATSPTG